ncbi:amiloride-sensitive sodium channel [Branchiostoma belcheri]|nr:amiloride-sensitive sodium channel [Branchiostoma belcheri]
MIQHRHGFRWGRDSEHLHSRFLRSRAPLPSRTTQGPRKPVTNRAKTAEGQEICLNFQNPSGCRRTSWNYAHVCITPGCGEPHLQCEHKKSKYQLQSPRNLQAWTTALEMDDDRDLLLDGLEHGFRILPEDSILFPAECDNYKSATDLTTREKVETQLRDELAKGNYERCREKPTIVSALGAIPKADSADVRLIHDCSRPAGSALNDYVESVHFSYQSIDDAVSILADGSYMAKIDLKSAYRSVPIHPSNYSATGLKWQFQGDCEYTFLVDKRLPFGARKAPEIFHRISQSVRRIMKRRGYHTILAYLDDFLIIGATYEECRLAFETLLELLQHLGFEINWHKVIFPTRRLTFLGIDIDAAERTLSLPVDKLNKLRTLLCDISGRKRVSKRDLLSLLGKLNWAAKVVRGGRTFMRRLIELSKTLRHPTISDD